MSKLIIQYNTKEKYGTAYNYPLSDDAMMIAKLCGRKTLIARDLEILTEAGHTVEYIPS